MIINPVKLRKAVKIITMVYAFPLVIIFPIILAFGNRPWHLGDYLFAGLGTLYLIGLFLGIEWPAFGGIIGLAFPLSQLLSIFRDLLKGPPHVTSLFGVSICYLVISTPCILYIITWIYSKKQNADK